MPMLSEQFVYGEQGPDVSICDLCSSWITHYPSNLKAKRISAQGMNAEELKANSQLSDFIVKDLNADPQLPFEDETFDAVTCALSVDYLTCPRQVFSEVKRSTIQLVQAHSNSSPKD